MAGKNPKSFQFVAQRWVTVKLLPVLAKHGITKPMASADGMLRLNNWHAWTLELGVSLDFVVTFVLKYFEKQRKTVSGDGLGLSIPAITGVKVRHALADVVYKTGGDQQVVRDARRKKMACVPVFVKCYGETTEAVIVDYRRKSLAVQKRLAASRSKFRRPFRGNPFS